MADKDQKPDPSDAAEDATDPEENTEAPKGDNPGRPDPTRYGDWEKKGRCIDF